MIQSSSTFADSKRHYKILDGLYDEPVRKWLTSK